MQNTYPTTPNRLFRLTLWLKLGCFFIRGHFAREIKFSGLTMNVSRKLNRFGTAEFVIYDHSIPPLCISVVIYTVELFTYYYGYDFISYRDPIARDVRKILQSRGYKDDSSGMFFHIKDRKDAPTR